MSNNNNNYLTIGELVETSGGACGLHLITKVVYDEDGDFLNYTLLAMTGDYEGMEWDVTHDDLMGLYECEVMSNNKQPLVKAGELINTSTGLALVVRVKQDECLDFIYGLQALTGVFQGIEHSMSHSVLAAMMKEVA